MTDNLDENSNSSNVVEIPDDAKPEDFPDLLEKTIVTFNTGDVIEGTVVRIDRNEILISILPCNHIYCEKCLEPWLKKSVMCPMCKRDIRTDKEDKVETNPFKEEFSTIRIGFPLIASLNLNSP